MEDKTEKINQMFDIASKISKSSESVKERILFSSAPAAVAGLTETQTEIYLKALLDARAIRKYQYEESDKIRANRKHSEEYRKEL